MAALDLDLLRTFLAVYDRRSLTAAAETLNVTQPSVSYALGKLRRQIGDPLFVRTRDGMEPTVRAEEIHAVVSGAVDRIDKVVAGVGFDPATARNRFRVALTDMGEFAYLPVLMERLAVEAPGIGVDVVPLDVDQLDRWIARGEVDAVVASATPTGRTPSELLFDDVYVCVHSWTHDLDVPVAPEELAGLRLAIIDSSSGHDRVGRGLAAAGIDPLAVLRVHHLSTLPDMLVRSGVAAIIPRRVAEMMERRWSVRARPLGDLVEGFDVRMFANESLHPSAARRWFLATLRDAVRVFAEETAP